MTKRQIAITCKEANDHIALLYVLRADYKSYYRSYSLNEKEEQKKGGKGASFKAQNIGRYGRTKYDFEIEYSREIGMALSKLWIVKSETRVSLRHYRRDLYLTGVW